MAHFLNPHEGKMELFVIKQTNISITENYTKKGIAMLTNPNDFKNNSQKRRL